MALHTVTLAKKVLLDFFQKIAGAGGRAPWSLAAASEIPPRPVPDAHSLPLQKGTADKSKPLCARRKLKNKKSAAPQGRKTS